MITVKKICGVETEHFLDTVHLNRSVVTAISRVQIDFKLNTDFHHVLVPPEDREILAPF